MMALFWLGSLFLMIYGLRESRVAFARLFAGWQRRVFEKSLDSDFHRMLPRALAISFFENSPQRGQQTGLALYNLRILGKRPAVLLMGLANLGAWWALILGFLFMNLSGQMLLGLCVVSLLSLFRGRPWREILRVLFGSGLFLLGGELLLRNSVGLQMSLGSSSWIFWLVDGRLPAVAGIFVLAFFLSLLIDTEFWSLCLALGILVGSAISFNGAIALIAGESCARGLLLAWSGRALNQDCRLLARWMGSASGVGALLGLLAAFTLKGLAGFGGSFGMEGALERGWQIMFCWTLILLVQFIVQMTVGHFLARGKVDEMQEARYFPVRWIEQERLSAAALRWGRARLLQRIHEIRYHLQGLQTFKANEIPEHVQRRLKYEEEELVRLQTYLDE